MEWIQQNPALAAALIAAGGALAGGLLAAAAKFVFDFYFSERIKRRWRTIDTKRQYSSQIIRAADDLAGRLSNLAKHLPDGTATTWLRPLDEDSEVPIIAWIELLKREQIFLDFASVRETRKFNSYLEPIYSVISYSGLTGSDNERSVKNHWIYYHYLGGIGDSLFKNEGGQLRCCYVP